MLEKNIERRIEKTDLTDTQKKAVNAVFDALAFDQREILVEMSAGADKAKVIQAILSLWENDDGSPAYNTLVLAKTKAETEQFEKIFKEANLDFQTAFEDTIYPDITLITQSVFLNHASKFLLSSYSCIICTDVSSMDSYQYEHIFNMSDATIIAFSPSFSQNSVCWLTKSNLVFSSKKQIKFFSENDAVNFLIDLFHYNGMANIEKSACIETGTADLRPDIIMEKNDHIIILEAKLYRSLNVSVSALYQAAFNLEAYGQAIKEFRYKNAGNRAIKLYLVAFCLVDSSIRTHFSEKYDIHILDVANLLYMVQNNPGYQKKLTELLPYSIENIDYEKPDQLLFEAAENTQENPEKLENDMTADALISGIVSCRPGKSKKADQIYETICTDIIHFLFSAEFSKELHQHKTADNLFRMDMLCALKGSAAFWKFLIQYYNTNFVVFEYKNYSSKISQNLIYTTEKYLFDAALRNVAFIISRKGFDSGAQNAALGCLKEHKKLIFDLTDDDLINMIRIKKDGGEPSDYMLSKAEDYLMSIGK